MKIIRVNGVVGRNLKFSNEFIDALKISILEKMLRVAECIQFIHSNLKSTDSYYPYYVILEENERKQLVDAYTNCLHIQTGSWIRDFELLPLLKILSDQYNNQPKLHGVFVPCNIAIPGDRLYLGFIFHPHQKIIKDKEIGKQKGVIAYTVEDLGPP